MAGRIVPGNTAENLLISGLDEFLDHLRELESNPSATLNHKLLDHISLQLTETNIPPLLPTVLPLLTQILKTTTQDPSPLLALSIKFLSPLTFTRALTIADPPSILTALASPEPGANLLAFDIILKASKTPTEAALLSTQPEIVEAFLKCWLESPDVAVGEQGVKVLGDLLETDCDLVPGGEEGVNGTSNHSIVNGTITFPPRRRRLPGHGRLWNLIFRRRPLLELLKSFWTPETTPNPTRRRHQTSIAQGRFLRILTRLAALNINILSQTEFPDVFPLPEDIVQTVGQGILQWAALNMVDKSDILMHLNLIDFYESFVSVMRVTHLTAEQGSFVRNLVRVAVQDDSELKDALRGLPNRTVEEEAEPLRAYINEILD